MISFQGIPPNDRLKTSCSHYISFRKPGKGKFPRRSAYEIRTGIPPVLSFFQTVCNLRLMIIRADYFSSSIFAVSAFFFTLAIPLLQFLSVAYPSPEAMIWPFLAFKR